MQVAGAAMSSLAFLCLLLLPTEMDSKSASENDTVVVTSSGPVKGKLVPAGSGTVTAYLGIPYAEPPLGKLRFQKPLPHQPWDHVLEATDFGSSCHQKTYFSSPYSNMWVARTPHSEDCLFLNIWVPHTQPSMPSPVLVWIHGGGFLVGTGSMDLYNGAFLAAAENVIVASINYRLGALGFLYLPPDAPGNVGLWDQWLALKWVKENAAAFGGDPDQLTLLGHSAGAASVGFHLLSPASQPLFARAVLQSGAPNAPWAWRHPEDAKRTAIYFGHLLGCTAQNGSNVVSCFQGKNISGHLLSFLEIVFSPTTDGDFLSDEPQKILQTGLIQSKPLLIGVTGDDGSVFVAPHLPGGIKNDGLLTWEQLLNGVKWLLRKKFEEEVAKGIALQYNEGHGSERYRWTLAQFAKDYYFVCPMAEVAAAMVAVGSPVYVYSFNHHISGSIWHEWMGAAHGAEVPYLFGTLASLLRTNQTYTEADAALSSQMMQYWAEFARSGHPTGSKPNEVQWPLYNATEQHFFRISTEAPQVMQVSPAQHCGFLTEHFLNATCKSLSHRDDASLCQVNSGKNGTRT
ncbi:cholinesterase-like isoform X2 [Hemicordylus capensis]|uniref:cholinesterase-like isoform X2 n=1 Tax=Hemicordylus capensis TaxID=884348 RepID=UPI0023034487|nr:cholinesterase-like isoform X2 [Hemicordylus capensis]